MIKRCDYKDCQKAGLHKCPKDRTLSDYWHFCQAHAAEYNKNWNYYAGMTPEEIEREWEHDKFGAQATDSKNMSAKEFQQALDDFLIGDRPRGSRPSGSVTKSLPMNVMAAFQSLKLGTGASWSAIQKKYRELAKTHHPDIGGDNKKFVKITTAYQTLKKYLEKK